MEKKKLTSPFCGNKELHKRYTSKVNPECEDIVTYKVVDRSVKTGEGPYDFVIVKEVIVVDRRNRQKEINKYGPDVGCLNVISKLAKQGINAADGRFASNSGYVDATILPQDLEGMADLAKELDPLTSKAWKALPDDIKKNMNMKDFAARYNETMLQDFIKAHYVKQEGAVPEKEGE